VRGCAYPVRQLRVRRTRTMETMLHSVVEVKSKTLWCAKPTDMY